MKTENLMKAAVLSLVVITAACGGKKSENSGETKEVAQPEVATVQNLKSAINGESTASAKYAAFSQKAKEEGFMSVSKLFEATSKSEATHARNHMKVLEDMGITYTAQLDSFAVNSTLENLNAALKGETYEVQTMYPDFMKQAEVDKNSAASQSFGFAFDTEKKHMILYQAAIDAVTAKKESSLAAEYYVCPKCGFTYSKNDVKANCELCGTAKDQFYAIK